MKKHPVSFFAGLFGAKGKAPAPRPQPVSVTISSQPHVLRHRMQEKSMSHGETVAAHLSPVRLDREPGTGAVLYFCPLRTLDVLSTVAPGDGGSLPPGVVLQNLSVPGSVEPGLYKLCHVLVSSNGSLQVSATAETRWEKIG